VVLIDVVLAECAKYPDVVLAERGGVILFDA
jgi:hypothetical protein